MRNWTVEYIDQDQIQDYYDRGYSIDFYRLYFAKGEPRGSFLASKEING